MVKQNSRESVYNSLVDKPLRWKEIRQRINISEPSLHNALKHLVKEKEINKKINDSGHVVYEINQETAKKHKKEMKEKMKTELVKIKQLEDVGLLSKGMDIKDVLPFVKTNDDEEGSQFFKQFKNTNIMSLHRFLHILMFTSKISGNAEIEGRIRITNKNPEKIKKEIKSVI